MYVFRKRALSALPCGRFGSNLTASLHLEQDCLVIFQRVRSANVVDVVNLLSSERLSRKVSKQHLLQII